MSQIPCKRNKCVLYPVCLNKETIKCDDLNVYADHLIQAYGRDKLWQYLKPHLPKINRVTFYTKQHWNTI